MVNVMAVALEEELEKLRAQNREQQVRAQEGNLPVKPILGEGEKAIAEITEYPQPDRRLKTFLADRGEMGHLLSEHATPAATLPGGL
ncbi:MAG: hypothetical protein ACP5JJ_16275 [Anaerolineae bacterium]